jgi:hypothetical protein
MALFLENEGDEGNALLLPEGMIPNYVSAANYFNSLQATLQAAVGRLCEDISGVHSRIKTDRDQEKGGRAKEEQFIRSETGHLFGLRVIENAVEKARTLEEIIKNGESAGSESEKKAARKHFLEETLKKLAEEFYRITRSVYHVLHPSKQYLRWVLDRELAAPREMFDAGELVFAATSYGAIQKWRLDNRLTRACEMLVESLPDNGRLPTKRPFHADRRGYRVIPIGCEMTRALATLMQKTAHHFDAKFVGKMLGVFEGQLIELHESTADKTLIGWNFEGAPDPDKPAVWVTAVSVLALDRIVRMLNTRINEIVLAHFDVTQPDRPHRELRLRDLIYADYALVRPDFHEDEEKFVAIHLQKARAHVMRATLPKRYRSENKNFSTIYYGPPNTGKTTFAQSLAFSAEVPLLRLSPGDLILQGQELIEGRAHDVFEALSMVTQCVIIFDEFEPVLKSRRSERKSSPKQMVRIGNLLEKISEKDDPKFKFVLGGMLPKLIKLHDSAEQQTFAYCLGTNYFSKIDLAAKRRGRFDKSLPVYKPDSLSRAGALLCRLGEAKKSKANGSIIGDVDELRRFFEVIARTVGEPADRISKLFGSEKSDGGEDRPAGTLRYILKDEGEPPSELKELGRNLETLKKEIRAGELEKGKDEQKQCEWIVDYETSIVNETRNTGTKTAAEIITLLNECLNGDKVRREPKARRHNLRSN